MLTRRPRWKIIFLRYQIVLISSKIMKGLSSLAESKIINTKLLKNKILNIDFIFIIFLIIMSIKVMDESDIIIIKRW